MNAIEAGFQQRPQANQRLARIAGFFSRLPFGNRRKTPERILVIRLGNLGDLICTLPAFHALRRMYPDAHLTLLTSPTKRGAPGAVEVLKNDTTFDEMIVYYIDESGKPGFLWKLLRQLRALRHDTMVLLNCDRAEFNNASKHLVIAGLSGVRRFAGYQLMEWDERHTHTADRHLGRVGQLGTVEMEATPWLHANADEEKVAVELLAPAAGKRLVAMQCGAKRPNNRWPEERFAEAGRRLVAEQNAVIVLTGSPGEREQNARVAEGIGAGCLDLTGKTNIGELAAVLAQCDTLITNDTGVMHVAAAVDTPCVAIFSGRDIPGLWSPYGAQHTILRKEIECSPCRADECPLYDLPKCVYLIEVDEVVSAVGRVLGATPDEPA